MKQAQLLTGHVMHQRQQPCKHRFRYAMYYVALPLNLLENSALQTILPNRRFALSSFQSRDHGARDGSSLYIWASNLLSRYAIPTPAHISLLCLPRTLGYVFNPVSFWLCYNTTGQLTTVLCEVNNTFGETYTYVCAHADQRPIQADDWLVADKRFHVSPFLQRTGQYRFRFACNTETCRIDIHYTAAKHTTLITHLQGKWQPLTKASLYRAFWQHPLVTLKAIAMIHYQALRLISKHISYKQKPAPFNTKDSHSH